ncbi:MAG: hypothetical protein V4490_06530 [Pseudomonadota bacterium]
MHVNNGKCQKCREIIARYPGFWPALLEWFNTLQGDLPEVHVSCAGRGQMDQEACFLRGASKAHWTKSAHNWNVGMDLWTHIEVEPKNLYDKTVFKEIDLHRPDWIEWYGEKGSTFEEFPHFQIKGWQELCDKGVLQLVE